MKDLKDMMREWLKDNPDELGDVELVSDYDFHPKGMLGQKQSDYQKQRSREYHTGKVVSKETRARMSAAKKGNTYASAQKGQVRKPESTNYQTLYQREYRKGIR